MEAIATVKKQGDSYVIYNTAGAPIGAIGVFSHQTLAGYTSDTVSIYDKNSNTTFLYNCYGNLKGQC